MNVKNEEKFGEISVQKLKEEFADMKITLQTAENEIENLRSSLMSVKRDSPPHASDSQIERLESAIKNVEMSFSKLTETMEQKSKDQDNLRAEMKKFVVKEHLLSDVSEPLNERIYLLLHSLLDHIEDPLADESGVEGDLKLIGQRMVKIFQSRAQLKSDLKGVLEERKGINKVVSVEEKEVVKSIVDEMMDSMLDSIPALKNYRQKPIPSVDEIVSKSISSIKEKITALSSAGVADGGISREVLESLLQEYMEKYEADKLGIPDYALGSAGARVVTELTTESFGTKSVWTSLLGIPLGKIAMHPSIALSVSVLFSKFNLEHSLLNLNLNILSLITLWEIAGQFMDQRDSLSLSFLSLLFPECFPLSMPIVLWLEI